MFISYEDFTTKYSPGGNILSEGTRIGKDFSTLNPILDPCRIFLTAGGEVEDDSGFFEHFEKGTWTEEGEGEVHTFYILQLQSAFVEGTEYPEDMVVLNTDETYTVPVDIREGVVGLVAAYSSTEEPEGS